MKRDGRNDNARWRKARANAIAAAHGICQLCGYALRPDAPPRSKWSTEVDHVRPLYQGGDPYDLANLRAVHKACNGARPRPGIRQPQTQRTSRIWRSRNW